MMQCKSMKGALIWFRQDLRIADNPAFFEACTHYPNVMPIFILDEKHHALGEAQRWWLHHSLHALKDKLDKKMSLKLILRKGDPFSIISELVDLYALEAVYWNRCYEPKAIERDKKIKTALQERGVEVCSFNGSLLNEPWTVRNKNNDYFKVFTPYWKSCRQHLIVPPEEVLFSYPRSIVAASDELDTWKLLPSLSWANHFSDYWMPGEQGAQQRLEKFISHHLHGYKINRDFPEKKATSYLSPHLHFGEISPVTIVRALESLRFSPQEDLASVEHFLSELGWREFSYYLLYHFPSLPSKNYKSEFDAFPWHKDESLLKKWQQGKTGYPIVDAGMRELWATGYMHNRVRMIVASFLTKGLLLDWRLGAAWFFDTLLDADLANNSASWQWVAGCGVDAAPYFRIFNPSLQSQKFDARGDYIRRWVPELASLHAKDIHAPFDSTNAKAIYLATNYPQPIINHPDARSRALSYYQALKA